MEKPTVNSQVVQNTSCALYCTSVYCLYKYLDNYITNKSASTPYIQYACIPRVTVTNYYEGLVSVHTYDPVVKMRLNYWILPTLCKAVGLRIK